MTEETKELFEKWMNMPLKSEAEKYPPFLIGYDKYCEDNNLKQGRMSFRSFFSQRTK